MATPDETSLAEGVALPREVEGFTTRRVELVHQAVKEWKRQLIDLGGRNNLLRYRDLKRGTLDLTFAESKAVTALLQGKAVKVSALFPDVDASEQVIQRARTLHKKAKENFEERGIETLSLACGLATWENKTQAWQPRAPVLLRQASLRPLGAAQDEFELTLLDEMEVNSTLLHLLKVDYDCGFDQEKLLDRVDGVIDEPWELDAAYQWMTEHASRVPGFEVDPRLVLANFAYAKLPMVRDLDNAFDELVAHQLIAAIAGDEGARERLRSEGPDPDAVPSPDNVPLKDEFLVLDADSSQDYAINAVIAGSSLIVKGPPGTGKSQTIANLIGSLIARGKTVLFVAEKRAAIDAVLKRLHQQKVGDLVLDLHGGVSSRRAFAQAIGHALAGSRAALKVENETELRRVEKRRTELNAYVAALHDKQQPWDVSVYEIRAELLGLGVPASGMRFRGEELERLGADAEREIEDDLTEYARLGGMQLASSDSPWAKSCVATSADVQRAHALVEDLCGHTLPNALRVLDEVSAQTGLPSAPTLNGWRPRLALLDEIRETLELVQPTIYEQDLERFCQALAPATKARLARFGASMFSGDYRSARKAVRGLRVDERKTAARECLRRCEAASEQLQRWRSLGGDNLSAPPSDRRDLWSPYQHVLEQLSELESWTAATALGDLPIAMVERLLNQLLADRASLVRVPELRRLERSVEAAGLGGFLAQMQESHASEEHCIQSLRHVWLQSILDHLSLKNVLIGSFSPEHQNRAVQDFKAGDHAHIDSTPARIRRACAEEVVRARETFSDQDEVLRHQSSLKRRHLPVRDLVRNTSDVLLALKPCWAMSPLVVSQLLPPRTKFDVVIFDEASQITPADAVSSIVRGSQLVVAGDERQLPPTAFFVSEAPEDDEEADGPESLAPLVAGTKGFESILDALGSLIGFRMLRWHYRSRDERLIAFSNAHIYDRMLTTFPGTGSGQVLDHVAVPWDPVAETNSPTPEVERVVELVLEHARTRPRESLGVIALGIKHANRIEEWLRQRLREDPALDEELSEFFDEEHEERFFVKNLERVQGDERDAIVLSIGYGKNSRGDLPYRFGPMLIEGGERRLNVAVTRAKSRLTLVSSFASKDMDPERSNAEGVKLLRQYLQYVESGGANLGDRFLERPALNPFEVDVRDTLSRRGLKLLAQYGSSGYWIDFAVQHPTQPGRFVLAIECDGATYHSSESARDRDRLRQEQLERLGWRFCRIWSSEWFQNKADVVEKVAAAYEKALLSLNQQRDDPPAVNREIPAEGLGSEASPLVPAKAARMESRPAVHRGLSIHDYPMSQLVQLAQWLESDEVLRTEDELLDEMMRKLGFQRRGKQVVAAIRAAIQQARR